MTTVTSPTAPAAASGAVRLRFVVPLAGLEQHSHYELAPVDGAVGLFTLRATDGPRLFVLDASVYLPQYTPELSTDQADEIGLTRPDDALLLVVANPGANGSTTTNLMAPIVVNTQTGDAAQFILDNQQWPLRAPLSA